MNNDLHLITVSLEAAAERCEDLTPLVFDTFFAMHPEAPGLFGKSIEVAKGRMLTEILDIVMEQAGGEGYVEHTVKTSASDHSFWGVSIAMYEGIFRALLDTFKKLLGDHWDAATEAAWQRQIDVIMDHTRAAFRLHHPLKSAAG